LNVTQVRAVRAEEATLAVRNDTAPRFDGNPSTVTTFTVNTTTDSGLANAAGTTCVDAATGQCSLRAAVEAADNRNTAVAVHLPAGTYVLTIGDALFDSDSGGLSITGTGASSTKIEGDGSGIFEVYPTTATAASAVLFLTGVSLTDGDTTYGGALYLAYYDAGAGAQAVLSDDALTGNTATDGGAIYAGEYDSLFLTDSTVAGNKATEGGGIWEYSSYLDLVGDTINSNSTIPGAPGSGGALYSEYGIVDVTNGSIDGNVAGDGTHSGDGGAVYDDGYAEYTLDGVTVNGNVASDGGAGGAFYLEWDQLDVTGGSMSHNNVTGADGYGGAIAVDQSSQLGLHGVTMSGDTVAGTVVFGEGGGTIYDYVDYVDSVDGEGYGNAVVIDSGTKITGSNNSAVYFFSVTSGATLKVSNSTISSDTDSSENASYEDGSADPSGCGGAICTYDYEGGSTSVNLTGDTIDNNSSTGFFSGGAVAVYNAEYSQSSVRLNGDTFRGNVGRGEYSSGAVLDEMYDDSSTSLAASGSSFADNSAPDDGYGGAIDVFSGFVPEDSSPANIALSGDHFTGNVAGSTAEAGDGGGLCLVGYATLSDNGSTFTGNRALGKDGEGGAIASDSYQSARFTETVLTGNSAPGPGSGGGAIATDDQSGDSYNGVTISGNSADSGGGVYSGAAQRYVDSTISGNTALAAGSSPGEGGGLYVDDLLFATNSTFSGNKANAAGATPGEGGGVFESGGPADFVYSTISANSAGLGSGIYEDGTGGSLLASIVAGNGSHNCTAAGSSETLSSLGDNVLSSNGCVTDVQSSDNVTSSPGLKPLANNGGPTKTMALTATSPAINRGGFDCPSTDQRGQPRTSTACDTGAYQAAPGFITKITPSRGKDGQLVAISGHGFTFARTVSFGAKRAHFVVISDDRIVATVPKGLATGVVTVTVLTPDGSSKVGSFTCTN
jgi:predicted outer membrane repeat protein